MGRYLLTLMSAGVFWTWAVNVCAADDFQSADDPIPVTPTLRVGDSSPSLAPPVQMVPNDVVYMPEGYEEISPPIHRDGGFTIPLGEDKKVKVGAGLRASFNLTEDGSPNGSDWNRDVNLDNMRIYLSGQAYNFLGFELNTDISNAQPLPEDPIFPDGGNVRLLDAVVKIEPHDLFNIWIGRFLPPSDRSNLSGPFYLNTYEFPFVQTGYPNIFQGREDGVAYWGSLGEGVLKWQAGMFRGREGFPNGDDHLMFTGRVTWNLLDPEPGYYNQSSYYGEKRILAIALAGMHQQDAVGLIADPQPFTGWSIDTLFETPIFNGAVLTLEGAFYNFNDNGINIVETAPGVFSPLYRQGESFFVLVAYLFPNKVGCGPIQGRLQPHVRYQSYDRDFRAIGAAEQGLDLGVHYVIDGHDARFTIVYQNRDIGGNQPKIDQILFGSQLQF